MTQRVNIPQQQNNRGTLLGAAGGIGGAAAGAALGPVGAIAGGMLGSKLGGQAGADAAPISAAGPGQRRMDHLSNATQLQEAQKALEMYPEYKKDFGPVLNNALAKSKAGGI